MDDLYFYHLANNHHNEVKQSRTKQLQPPVSRTGSIIGSMAVVFLVLYWLSTLGV